ncbi:hypothetical protein Tco_0772535 [Tanacetum coccineum]|uniref:Transposase (putative) gypsy type domain-containing protein n=1 Tax=Tanacetum coccineum TaxID=301880 RepID=A0ABQ4ZI50_9ASTR
MVLQLTDFTSEITDEELREFTSEYYIPSALHPVVPAADASIADFPVGKVGVYTRFFEFANQRVPLSLFMCNILNHYRLHISQLHCIGAAKISNFEVNCRLLAINPTVHLFRAFYHTCWSNGWVSFSKRAGRLQCYTEKLDALRRWREMFFWVDDALVPWNFAFYTQGLLPRDERPPPGSYSIEDAELINENRIPINAYSEAFLCHMGISRNYFQRPEEVPTFIGEDGREMDLFSVVHLSKPKQVTEGVRPLRDGEEPLLESTAGRTMELVLEQPEIESTDVLAPTPLRSVPSVTVEPPMPDATSIGSSEDADVAEVDSGLKRKRATGDDGAGPSKRVRHLSLGLSTSTEEESSGASPTLAAKEETETPPPKTRDPGLGPKAFEGMPLVDQLMEELIMVLRSMRAEVEGAVGKAGGEVRNFSNEYDEELYTLHVCPLLLSEGRHKTMGCACAMALWNIKEVKQVLWDVVMCALARGKWKGGRKLLEKIVADSGLPPRAASDCPQLVRDQDYPIDVIMAGLTLARHATEGAEAQPDYFLKPDVAHTAGFLSFAMSACHLKSFLIEKGLRLKESDHPRSDGVPVSVATVSPKDSELLGKLEEAEDVAYQVGSSEQSRCHSI